MAAPAAALRGLPPATAALAGAGARAFLATAAEPTAVSAAAAEVARALAGSAGAGAGAGGFGGFGSSGGLGGGYGGGSGNLPGGGGGGGGLGGAIFSEMGSVTITDSTLFGNSVTGGTGGAGFQNGPSGPTGSSGSSGPTGPTGPGGPGGYGGSGLGGAVFAAGGMLTITNSTLSGNSVTGGAGATAGSAEGRDVYLADNGGGVSAVINNSILGQTDDSISDFSSEGNSVSGSTSSGSNNLISNPGRRLSAAPTSMMPPIRCSIPTAYRTTAAQRQPLLFS